MIVNIDNHCVSSLVAPPTIASLVNKERLYVAAQGHHWPPKVGTTHSGTKDDKNIIGWCSVFIPPTNDNTNDELHRVSGDVKGHAGSLARHQS